ncbi:MAG: hypothetical protein EOP04_16460, partial [Proteobacteria bacterium]
MKVDLRILALVGLAACSPKPSSSLKHVKIQTGERLPSLVIRSDALGGGDLISSISPNRTCNNEKALGLDFTPSATEVGASQDCDVYGHSTAGSFWLSRVFPQKTILMDNSRFEFGVGFPLGKKYQPTDQAKFSVNICSGIQVSGDSSDDAGCLIERSDYFEEELAGIPEVERKQRLGKALIEALQVLTYSDSGLSRCYEESLFRTEAYESLSRMPTDPGYNPFQSIRRRTSLFPATSVELIVLKDKIKKLPVEASSAYQLRSSLANRLGFVPYGQLVSSPLYFAHEPFPLDHHAVRDAEASKLLEAAFGVEARELGKLKVSEVFRKIEQISSVENGLNVIQARGYVSSLPNAGENIKSTVPMSSVELKILTDLLYKAVLLTKATNLNPLSVLSDLSSKLGESCKDYGDYRFGLKNRRSELVQGLVLANDSAAQPKLFLEPSALLEGK